MSRSRSFQIERLISLTDKSRRNILTESYKVTQSSYEFEFPKDET